MTVSVPASAGQSPFDAFILKSQTLQNAATGTQNGVDMDVSGMATLTLLITTADSYTGTVTFNASPNGTTFDVIRGNKQGTTTQATSVAVSGTSIWEFQVSALKKFRASIAGDNTNHVTVVGFASPIPNFSPIGVTLSSAVLAAGSALIGGANIVDSAGTNKAGVDAQHNVQVSDGGSNYTHIAAGATSDTVVKASAGRLCKIIVIVAGSNAMLIYDNASAGSGTPIGGLAASAAAGSVTSPQVPAANGITVKGNASNPEVVITWS